MALLLSMFIVFMLKCIWTAPVQLNPEEVITIEGYIKHPQQHCQGYSLIGGHRCERLEECYDICEEHAECVAFYFESPDPAWPYKTPNCYPDTVCETLTHSEGWTTYKKIPGRDGQCFKTFGPYGTDDGQRFSDENMKHAPITAVTVGMAMDLHSIALRYGNSTVRSHGYDEGFGEGGITEVTTELHTGEYITGIQGRYSTVLNELKFITNERSIGPYGSDVGTEFAINNHGKPLLYISGVFDMFYLRSMSFHFAC